MNSCTVCGTPSIHEFCSSECYDYYLDEQEKSLNSGVLAKLLFDDLPDNVSHMERSDASY